MNKSFLSVLLFVFLVLPITMFSYQNCSELPAEDIQKLSQKVDFNGHEPLIITDLNQIDSKITLNCTGADDMENVFYNSKDHICAVAKSDCESEQLIELGFSLDEQDNCFDAQDSEEMSLNGFSRLSPEELGYESTAGACTQIVMDHVNLFTRECSLATNGCKINFLRSNNFIEDRFSICQ